MNEEVICQIKDAENRAEQTVQQAQTEADAIIREARHKVVEDRQSILEAARQKAKTIFESGAQELEPDLDAVRHTFQEAIDRETDQAQQKLDEVIKFVVAQFKERLESA
jgi:vacuolar-type H+-ATPase subunit H